MVDGIANFDPRLFFLRVFLLGMWCGLGIAYLMRRWFPPHIFDCLLPLLNALVIFGYLALRMLG